MNPAGEGMRPLPCARPGCGPHRYDQHAPGGGACMFWDPVSGEHCICRGFQWVSIAEPASRYRLV